MQRVTDAEICKIVAEIHAHTYISVNEKGTVDSHFIPSNMYNINFHLNIIPIWVADSGRKLICYNEIPVSIQICRCPLIASGVTTEVIINNMISVGATYIQNRI